MSAPLSWQLLEWLRDNALARIRTANGYHTDAGAQITLEPVSLDEGDPYPAIWLYEDDTETFEPGPAGVFDLHITCECAIKGSSVDSHRRAHRVRSDLLRALPRKPAGMPNGVLGFEITRSRILPRAEDERGLPYTIVHVVMRARLADEAPPAA